MRKQYAGFLFIELIIIAIVLLAEWQFSLAADSLTAQIFYALALIANIGLFFSLANAPRWDFLEAYLFFAFILVSAGGALGLFDLTNVVINLVLLIALVLALIGVTAMNGSGSNKIVHVVDKKEEEPTVYVASKTGKTYHDQHCMIAKRIRKGSRVLLSMDEAAKKGYKPCKGCLVK